MDLKNIDLEDVTFRPLKTSDYDDLIRLGRSSVKETLEKHPDKLSNQVIACDFVKSLNNSNYCEVAEYEGRAIGVLMGRCDSNFSSSLTIGSYLKDKKNHFNLLLNKSGRDMLKHLGSYDKYDRELIESAEKDFDGELVYFNLEPEIYDSDVGYALFEHFREFMRQSGAHNFFLLVHSEPKKKFFEDNYFKLLRTMMFEHDGQRIVMHLFEYDVTNPIKKHVINYVKNLLPDIDINLKPTPV